MLCSPTSTSSRPAESNAGITVPVTLLTGFLGSGKTTLLNRILADERMKGAAVVINEFGSVSVDHDLVHKGSERDIVTTTGCLCCSATSDVRTSLFALREMARRREAPAFDRVIVETAGLSRAAARLLARSGHDEPAPRHRRQPSPRADPRAVRYAHQPQAGMVGQKRKAMKLDVNPPRRNPLARNPRIPEATAAIKGWARTALDLGDDAVMSINELSCAQPDCPPRETVILVLRSGTPALRISIHKAIVDISQEDVIAAGLDGAETLQPKGHPGSA